MNRSNCKYLVLCLFLVTMLVMLSSVSASDVNVSSSDSVVVSDSSIEHDVGSTVKSLKMDSTDGYVYVNSNGSGDGKSITSPTNLTNGLKNVTNGGTVYLVTSDESDTYSFEKVLSISSSTVSSGVRNFTIAAQDGKTIVFTGNNSTVLRVTSTFNVNISGVTFKDCNTSNYVIENNGNLTVINSSFIGNNNSYTYYGGVIYNNYNNLKVINSSFINNTALNNGGAIYNNVGSVTVVNSTFTNNTAIRGGAIYSDRGALTVSGSTFTDNSASYGGAITTYHSYISAQYILKTTVINNTFTSNNASYGGALYDSGANTTVVGNTFVNNSATNDGGAILSSRGNHLVENNTFTSNEANHGGAIFAVSANQTITDNTFTDNVASDASKSIYSNFTTQVLSGNNIDNSTIVNKGQTIEGTKDDRTVYNTRDVVPANASESFYIKEDMPDTSSIISFSLKTGQPIPFNDGATDFCMEPTSSIPVKDSVYERQVVKDQVVSNRITRRNMIEYVKAYLVLFFNNSDYFDNPSDLNTFRTGIDFFTYYNINDPVTLAYTVPGFKYPLSFYKEAVEAKLASETNKTIPNRGVFWDNVTTYQFYFYDALDEYNGGYHYQDMLGISLNVTELEMSWAWKLENKTTTINITENYTENVTTIEEYNETEEYIVNVTETVPYNDTEEYVVNVTKTVPYNATEEYTVNVTETVPYNATEEYVVDITETVPYNETEEYIVNVTKSVPYNVTEEYTVNVTKVVPYNVTEEYVVNVTKTVAHNTTGNVKHTTTSNIVKPSNVVSNGVGQGTTKNNVIPTNKTTHNKPNTNTVYRNITTQETRNRTVTMYHNVTTQETRNRTVTKYQDVTTQETRTRTVTKYTNVTRQETRNRTVTKYMDVTREEVRNRTVTKYENITTQETRNRTVTKYTNVTKQETRTRIVTKTRPVTHEEQRTRIVSKTVYQYRLYVYLLYLEGKISYEDLVAIIGEENIAFDEQGQIIIDYDSLDDIPSEITVTGSSNDAIPTTSDDVDLSNPDGLDEPVMDAGVVTTEL
ncbi:hypothetical protein [Methanosphaera sp.]